MATGRKTVVAGQVIDPVVWGNPLWDQSVQTFASAADRTAQFAAPKQGAVTWLEDLKRLEVYTGTRWSPVPASATVLVNATTDASGLINVAHPLGVVPSGVSFALNAGTADAIMNILGAWNVWSASASTIALRFIRNDTHTWMGSGGQIGGYLTVTA